ncbi:hypothetical protein, partial [Halorubrum yunnanense]
LNTVLLNYPHKHRLDAPLNYNGWTTDRARAKLSCNRRVAPVTRLGRREVLCGAVWGGTQRGSREGEARRSKYRSEEANATERGTRQAARAVATGALEAFTVDSQLPIA